MCRGYFIRIDISVGVLVYLSKFWTCGNLTMIESFLLHPGLLCCFINLSSFAACSHIWTSFIYSGSGAVIEVCWCRQYKHCDVVDHYHIEDLFFCVLCLWLFVVRCVCSSFSPFVFPLFLLFPITIIALIFSSRATPICFRYLRPFLHATAHRIMLLRISPALGTIWMLVGSVLCIL